MTELPMSHRILLARVRRLGVVERDELHPAEVQKMEALVSIGAVEPTLPSSGVDGWVPTPLN